MNNKYFILHQDCQIIKGAKNIILCDLYRNKIINISEIYSLFRNDRFMINNENNSIISILLKEDFGYLSNSNEETSQKNHSWHSPSLINEIIIEHANEEDFDLLETYNSIEIIGAEFLQIRFIDFNFVKLKSIMSILNRSCVRTLEILIPYINEETNEKIIYFLKSNKRVQIIYFYDAPFNKSIQESKSFFNILYYEKNLVDVKFCGVVNEDYFLTDLKNFSKSKNFNNCLKDKLFISSNGNIKNCPSMTDTIFNITDFSLKSLIDKVSNDKNRNITKDKIKVCKDCEYRYFCIDCRAYTENTEDNYAKPLKCGYNPYTGEWQEWSTNPLKQKAIQHYGMENII